MQERAQRISRSRSAPRRGALRRPCFIVTQRTHIVNRPLLGPTCCEALSCRRRWHGGVTALLLPPSLQPQLCVAGAQLSAAQLSGVSEGTLTTGFRQLLSVTRQCFVPCTSRW
ncbi:hypothetical protein JTB14_036582 [Gonioctena quinquepunctata]|nr:hypothetical protein JTB14_036582 [Gonioctena quinquepunctata]